MADNQKGHPGFKWAVGYNSKPMPTPFLVPVASGYTGAINGGTTVDINPGDPVRRLSTGYFAHAAGNEGGSGGETIYGICVAVAPYYDGSAMVPGNRLPANTVYGTNFERQSFIHVVPANAGLWAIDCDDSSTATTYAAYLAFLGENADHRLTAGSEPKTNCLLDISTHGTATAQWRIEHISRTAKNQDFSGLYVELIVSCNEGQQPEFTATGI